MSKKALIDIFDGQRDSESVDDIVHKSAVFLWKPILIGLLLFSVFIVCLMLNFINMYVCITILLLILFIIIHSFIIWYFSIYIITNQRIRTIKQNNLFTKEVFDIEYSKIQHVAYKIPNIVGYFMNYGTIIVQTDSGDLVMRYIPEPDKIYNLLQNLIKGN